MHKRVGYIMLFCINRLTFIWSKGSIWRVKRLDVCYLWMSYSSTQNALSPYWKQ